jgi:hypothetical protein
MLIVKKKQKDKIDWGRQNGRGYEKEYTLLYTLDFGKTH